MEKSKRNQITQRKESEGMSEKRENAEKKQEKRLKEWLKLLKRMR